MPAFRRRDKLLSHVRAYSKLSPGERRTLLTHKGARERLATIGLTRCQSCPDLRRRSDQSTNQVRLGCCFNPACGTFRTLPSLEH